MAYTQSDRERQRYVTYIGTDPLPTFSRLFGAVGLAQDGVQARAPGVIRTTARGVARMHAALALTPGARSLHVRTSYRDSLRETGNPVVAKRAPPAKTAMHRNTASAQGASPRKSR